MRFSRSGPQMRANSLIAPVCVFLALLIGPSSSRADTADIVIYGATSSGVIAAIQAHRMGKSVVLIEPTNHVGGLTTGGLGATDIGNKAAIGGLAREFYHRVWQHYQDDSAWHRERREEYERRNPHHDANDDTMWMFEPHVASEIYAKM